MQEFPGGYMKKQRVFWICMLVLLYSMYAGYWWERIIAMLYSGSSGPFFHFDTVQRMITIRLLM